MSGVHTGLLPVKRRQVSWDVVAVSGQQGAVEANTAAGGAAGAEGVCWSLGGLEEPKR